MNLKALILVFLIAGVSFAGISVNGFTVSNSFFKPGEPGAATVTVSNPSGTDQVSSISMTINSPPEIIITSSPSLADITAGGSTVVTLPFTVKANATPGIYLVNVVFTGYINQPSTGSTQSTVNTASIPITVVNPPLLSFSTNASSLSGIENISLNITNFGGRASNLEIVIPTSSGAASNSNSTPAGSSSLTSSGANSSMISSSVSASTVALYGADQIFVPSVDQNGNVIVNVTLDVRNSPDGPTDVPLVIQYDDELGITHSGSGSMRITVRNEKLDLGIVQQSEIITKTASNLTIQITNNGPNPIQDVRLSFSNSTINLKNQNELKFGDLNPGQTSTVSAIVNTNLPPGVNNLGSMVSWIDKDVQKQEDLNVPITVTSDADVGVYLDAKPLPLTLGDQHTLSVLVSNLGSYAINNVDVTVTSPALSSLDISNTQYIGGLNSDDFSTVQFLVQVNATQAGSYPITLVINYRDQSGEQKQKIVQQTINVDAPPATNNDPLPLIIVGIVIVAVAVWWFKFRKK